jgi:pimeloyl-ACP methyl ester carboxylesterase
MPTTTITLYDRDTAPGAEPEELQKLRIPTLVIPGDDPFHATSAAQYLAMQLPQSEYWDAPGGASGRRADTEEDSRVFAKAHSMK